MGGKEGRREGGREGKVGKVDEAHILRKSRFVGKGGMGTV